MMRLDSVFTVKNGIASSQVEVHSVYSSGFVAYIRPSNTQGRTLAGWIDPSTVPSHAVFPKETLFVSTDGEGSHTHAYVSDFDFIANSNVSVLIPKQDMTIQEKIFYARCITMNRYKFSYGRKPKGERLKSIALPSQLPDSVVLSTMPSINFMLENRKSAIQKQIPQLNPTSWKPFLYKELFEIERGRGPLQKDLNGLGCTPLVTSSDSNNGVTGYTDESPMHQGNVLSVNRNGSVGEAFYQRIPFCSTDNVHIFIPKFVLTPEIAMFLVTLIGREKSRYSYGRTWSIERMNNSVMYLPVTQHGIPDWKYIEKYIKTLPYSSRLS